MLGASIFASAQTGKVGINTTTPGSTLEVNGAATNTVAFDAGSSSSVSFETSNLAFTSASSNAITLTNLKDGGAYTLVVTATSVSDTVAFTSTGFSFKYMGTGARTSGKTHIYSLIVAGTNVYVTMATEN